MLASQQLTPVSQYRKTTAGVQGTKVSCFELKQHATSLGRGRVVITNAEGIAEFNNLGFGFYIVRCNDDSHTDHIVEVDPRTFAPDVKLVKFEVNI